ncbi:PREDICTED: uncharacterized protein LOC106742419 isoform X2 [Dinoponera quadriceps]|uniref:Uncharacterized protein LOC106742419 isoform X2 n=1 Tax=Dinoponera quadriceps TaxID=609295 RepID=A0A6P3WXH5_DINQU|nr:PREDICTED: uncharacterized protein LOC106742419 isoform X2 [Dinoponera quadriceps]
MSNFTDLPQLLDISSISAISQSSSRFVDRMDMSQSLLEYNFSAIKSSNKPATAHGLNSAETLMKSLTLCEENTCEYMKANIIYQCMKEACLDHKSVLSKNAVTKLKALLLTHELDKYMHLPSSPEHAQDNLTLLGINDLPLSDLSFDEKLEIKCCVETMLREKIHDMILRYEAIGGNVKEALKSNEYNMRYKILECDTRIIEWKSRIEEVTVEYESALQKYINLMDKWNELKYEDMSKAYLEKSQHLLLQAQVAELQAKMTKLSCRIKMFNETPTTINAFRLLNQAVEEKLKAVTDEIRQKEDLKKLYENLKNTEYDEVLKNYTELCKAIKKKEQMLNMLK